MHLPEEPEQPLTLNIVPMLDVIFAILAFFIISSLFLTRSEGLEVNLPAASTVVAQENVAMTISIETDGAIALDGAAISLDRLEQAVRDKVEPNSTPLIAIQADEKASHGRVVAVMDRLRRVEGVQLAIAAQKP